MGDNVVMKHLFLAFFLIFGVSAAHAEGPTQIPLLDQPREVEAFVFADAEGNARSLQDFKGKVVLVNLWATWCVPCRTEMPQLDRLQAELGSDKFTVLPLSLDRGGAEAVNAFYKETELKSLPVMVDQANFSARAFRIFGLPSTFLVNAEGKEIGRLVGPAEWDDPRMVAFLQGVIEQGQKGL